MDENSNVSDAAPEPEVAGSAEQSSTATEQPAGDYSWQEVGQQFQALGQSIAEALRTALDNEETQRQLHEMRTGLKSMVKEVGDAIDQSAQSPQGQKIRQNANKAAETLRTAGEQTVQEVRPKLIEALQQLNRELQRWIDRMSNKAQ